ncbi:hypothetical protein ABIA16_004734 [Sinorhizobium fredii]
MVALNGGLAIPIAAEERQLLRQGRLRGVRRRRETKEGLGRASGFRWRAGLTFSLEDEVALLQRHGIVEMDG